MSTRKWIHIFPIYCCLVTLLGGCLMSSQVTDETAHALETLLSPPDWPAKATRHAPTLDTEELARSIHILVDSVRTLHRLQPLAWEQRLADMATDHSQDMAQHPFFGHTNPQGQQPTDRARKVGLPERIWQGFYFIDGIGENLFLTHRYREYRIYQHTNGLQQFDFDWKTTEELAKETVELWMKSHTHRANLLSPLYKATGIGIVHTAEETLFITQNFSCQEARSLIALDEERAFGGEL